MQNVIYPVFSGELPIYLTGIGISEPEYCIERPQGLVSHQFLFTLDGEGFIEYGGEKYPQTKGSFFYLAPSVPHKYAPLNNCWKTAWIVFRGQLINSIMDQLKFSDFAVQELPEDDTSLTLFSRIFAAASDSVNGGRQCSALLYELILHISLILRQPVISGSNRQSIVQRTIEYIDQHYAEDMPIDALAELSGVTVQHLCRRFRSEMNMRPLEYIARRRIARAKQLLMSTDKSIAEIAAEVGYSGLTYFGMVFRKYEGMSPREFRRCVSI